jgi:hypothetical protein
MACIYHSSLPYSQSSLGITEAMRMCSVVLHLITFRGERRVESNTVLQVYGAFLCS